MCTSNGEQLAIFLASTPTVELKNIRTKSF